METIQVSHPGSCDSKPLPLGNVVVTRGLAHRLRDVVIAEVKKTTLTTNEDVEDASVEAAVDIIVGTFYSKYIRRHSTGDWGDLCPEDREQNQLSLDPEYSMRIFSMYSAPVIMEGLTFEKIYIITEHDRSVTTLLLPEEY